VSKKPCIFSILNCPQIGIFKEAIAFLFFLFFSIVCVPLTKGNFGRPNSWRDVLNPTLSENFLPNYYNKFKYRRCISYMCKKKSKTGHTGAQVLQILIRFARHFNDPFSMEEKDTIICEVDHFCNGRNAIHLHNYIILYQSKKNQRDLTQLISTK
jgi:hypothetical protein